MKLGKHILSAGVVVLRLMPAITERLRPWKMCREFFYAFLKLSFFYSITVLLYQKL